MQLFWYLEDRFSKNTCLKFCLVCLVSEFYRHKNESGCRFWEWATPSQCKEQEKVFIARWHSIHMILETTNCLMVLEQLRYKYPCDFKISSSSSVIWPQVGALCFPEHFVTLFCSSTSTDLTSKIVLFLPNKYLCDFHGFYFDCCTNMMFLILG